MPYARLNLFHSVAYHHTHTHARTHTHTDATQYTLRGHINYIKNKYFETIQEKVNLKINFDFFFCFIKLFWTFTQLLSLQKAIRKKEKESMKDP